MSDRIKLSEGGNYFSAPSTSLDFISSGCQLLDCVLGGGYPIGRIVNIVGDKSTGKTLLAIEAAANFAANYKDGKIWYREAEAAFDKKYAKALGMPIDRMDFGSEEGILTVEDVFEDLGECIKNATKSKGLYILDSLDALSDRSELERAIDEGTYGATKAKKLSELFRRLVQGLHQSNICVIIISQVRDNIGVAFGEKYSRSGGKALDFYASQALWLSQIGQIKKTKKGVSRTIGINIKARCKKNKVGQPFRECEFPIIFGYGVDDFRANLNWLISVNKDEKERYETLLKALPKMSNEAYEHDRYEIAYEVNKLWYEIEKSFLPERKKY